MAASPRKPAPPRKPAAAADPRPDVLDQLRRALREDPRTPYAIAAEAGVHRIQISRFLAGGDLAGKSIARLCKALRQELRAGRGGRAA